MAGSDAYRNRGQQTGALNNPQSYSEDDIKEKSWLGKLKDKLVMSPEQMEATYNNKDSQYYKQNIEPKVELSKAMAEGMTEPLGAGGNKVADAIANADLDGVKLQTAGIGEDNETETTSDTSNASVAADTNNGESDGASETVSDIIQNNPQETQRYTNSMMGIWDAFREGKIDQGTALYFTLDSISKLARNTGKDLANIGAAFTGGTINNEREDSLWSQRRNQMFENELAGEVESQGGTPAYRAMLHDLNSLSMEDKNLFAKDIENWLANNSKGITIDMLKQQLAAMGYANIANQFDTFTQKELLDMSKSNDPATAALGKAGISAANVVNSSGGAIGKAIGSALTK